MKIQLGFYTSQWRLALAWVGPKIRQLGTLLCCLIWELSLTKTVFKVLLAQTEDRLNQISSSKCKARRLQSHQLSAQQTWVCAKQVHEGTWVCLAFGCRVFHLLYWQQQSSWRNDRAAGSWRGVIAWPWPPLPRLTRGPRGPLGSLSRQHMKDTPEPLWAAWPCRTIREQLTGNANSVTGKWNTFTSKWFKLQVGEPATWTCRSCLRQCFHWGHITYISSLPINQEVDSVAKLKRNSVVQEAKLKYWLFEISSSHL